MGLDLDKPLQTAEGRPVRLLKLNAKGGYPLIGVVESPDGKCESPCSWRADGTCCAFRNKNDLVNVPARTLKRKVFLVFSPIGSVYCYDHKPRFEEVPIFGIKELDVEVTEGENLP